MKILIVFLILTTSLIFTGCAQKKKDLKTTNNLETMKKTDAEWKEILTPQQFYVLRQKGTDAPSEDGYTNFFEKGTYVCAACGAQLFASNSKFESHCGWPSFDDAIKGSVIYKKDTTFGMIRTEIICANCGGHLGHVFDDGPQETTGQRYCVNTTSIKFIKGK